MLIKRRATDQSSARRGSVATWPLKIGHLSLQALKPAALLNIGTKRPGHGTRHALRWPVLGLSRKGSLLGRFLTQLTGHWRLLAAALVAGAIIHILVTLHAAQFSQASFYRILTKGLPVNTVTFLPPVTSASQPLPFLAPGAFYSLCPYDASTARIRVSAKLPDAGWSLSLHTPKGENFYYVPGTERQETAIELVLEPPGNVFSHDAIEITTANKSLPTVKLPEVRGLIVVRAPIKGRSYLEQADQLRTAFMCGAQDGRPQR